MTRVAAANTGSAKVAVQCSEYILKNRHTLQSNYFDQSHFIKEIKKYTGATPTELEKMKMTDFYNYQPSKDFNFASS